MYKNRSYFFWHRADFCRKNTKSAGLQKERKLPHGTELLISCSDCSDCVWKRQPWSLSLRLSAPWGDCTGFWLKMGILYGRCSNCPCASQHLSALLQLRCFPQTISSFFNFPVSLILLNNPQWNYFYSTAECVYKQDSLGYWGIKGILMQSHPISFHAELQEGGMGLSKETRLANSCVTKPVHSG